MRNLARALARLRITASRGFSQLSNTGTPDYIEVIVKSLPPERSARIISDLITAKEEIARAKDEVLKEKDIKIGLMARLGRMQRNLAKAMHYAGVTSGRTMLDYVQACKGFSRGMKKSTAWAQILADDDELLQCILTQIPVWARAVHGKSKEEQQSIIASKIVTIHGELSIHVHSFAQDAGLTIYEGVPNMMVTTVLRCVAEHNGIPYNVQKAPLVMDPSNGGSG